LQLLTEFIERNIKDCLSRIAVRLFIFRFVGKLDIKRPTDVFCYRVG